MVVSIIIPVYNVEAYIADCLSSVMSQDYAQLEVVIVDDCTPDKSIQIVEQMISQYKGGQKHKIIRHKTNLGISAARNTGIKEASGDLIYFLDSDDYICPGAIRHLVEVYNLTHADIVAGNVQIVDEQADRIVRKPVKLSKDFFYFENLKKMFSCKEIKPIDLHGVVWNKLICRHFLEKNQLYFDEGIIFEDIIWNYKTYCCEPNIAVSGMVSYIYRTRPSSIMTTFTEYHMYSIIKCADIVIEYTPGIKKSRDMWYVRDNIELYIYAALYKIIDKVNNKQAFDKLYTYYRNRHKPKIDFWINIDVPLSTKIKSLHYLLPASLGRKYLFILLKQQKKNMCKLYPNQAALPMIELSTNFWNCIGV